jgi:hypothetical protein
MRRFSLIMTAVCVLALTSAASATSFNVAILSAMANSTYDADVVAKIQANASFLNITVINVATGTSTPTPDLTTYAAVMVIGNGDFADSAALGTDLYNFINAGGGVVVAYSTNMKNGSPCTAHAELCGSWASTASDYWAIEPTATYVGPRTHPTLGTIHDPSSPLLAGVSTFDGGTVAYYAAATLNAAAVDVADWSDGTPLIVTRSVPGAGKEVALNFYPPSSDVNATYNWKSSTDGGKILANALLWSGDISAAPEGDTLILAGAGLGLLSLLLKRRR